MFLCQPDDSGNVQRRIVCSLRYADLFVSRSHAALRLEQYPDGAQATAPVESQECPAAQEPEC